MSSLIAYKSIVDELVERSHSVKSEWVKNGQFPDTDENAEVNDLLRSLTTKQRDVVSKLINDAKSSGVHDTLSFISELQNVDNLELTLSGKLLPVEPFGTPLNFDYVARYSGDQWPEL